MGSEKQQTPRPEEFTVNGRKYRLRPMTLGLLRDIVNWLKERKATFDNWGAIMAEILGDPEFLGIILGELPPDAENWSLEDYGEVIASFLASGGGRLAAIAERMGLIVAALKSMQNNQFSTE